LILGETGTGKELVARALHDLGSSAAAPFVPINCVAISPVQFEETVFGTRQSLRGLMSKVANTLRIAPSYVTQILKIMMLKANVIAA
jgi:DNA-binding NtrC family response regulator